MPSHSAGWRPFSIFIFELGESHMLGVASLTFFLYDILLTLDQEVTLIHKGARWSFPKVLYLLNRYYVLIVMVINTFIICLPAPSDQFCSVAVRFSGLGAIAAKYVLDLWLILRVYALWGRDLRVMLVLGSFFFANVCVTCIVGAIALHNALFLRFPEPRLPGNLMTGCFLIPPTTYMWIIFVSPLVFEGVVFAFTIWKAVRHDCAPHHTPLFTHLYRTGVACFAVMALTMAFMSSTALITPLQHVVIPSQFLCAFVSSVCARMMLGIRAVMRDAVLGPEEIRVTGVQLTTFPGVACSETEVQVLPGAED